MIEAQVKCKLPKRIKYPSRSSEVRKIWQSIPFFYINKYQDIKYFECNTLTENIVNGFENIHKIEDSLNELKEVIENYESGFRIALNARDI